MKDFTKVDFTKVGEEFPGFDAFKVTNPTNEPVEKLKGTKDVVTLDADIYKAIMAVTQIGSSNAKFRALTDAFTLTYYQGHEEGTTEHFTHEQAEKLVEYLYSKNITCTQDKQSYRYGGHGKLAFNGRTFNQLMDAFTKNGAEQDIKNYLRQSNFTFEEFKVTNPTNEPVEKLKGTKDVVPLDADIYKAIMAVTQIGSSDAKFRALTDAFTLTYYQGHEEGTTEHFTHEQAEKLVEYLYSKNITCTQDKQSYRYGGHGKLAFNGRTFNQLMDAFTKNGVEQDIKDYLRQSNTNRQGMKRN